MSFLNLRILPTRNLKDKKSWQGVKLAGLEMFMIDAHQWSLRQLVIHSLYATALGPLWFIMMLMRYPSGHYINTDDKKEN
jgi:hypothetical protein